MNLIKKIFVDRKTSRKMLGKKKIKEGHMLYVICLITIFFQLGFNPYYTCVFLKSSDMSSKELNIDNSVTYKIEVEYTIKNSIDTTAFFRIEPFIFKNNGPISYQNSKVLYIKLNNKEILPAIFYDEYRNEFNRIEMNVSSGETIKLQCVFIVTVRDIKVNEIDKNVIGTYNKSDELHSLYCIEEIYCEIFDPDLIALSNDITNIKDGPLEKARDIFDWIVDNIEFEKNERRSGALSTYKRKKGVCGDISNLMVALLRVQGIPARRVYGFALGEEEPERGNSFKIDELSNHAWDEYYVPDVGWIACDPTYGISSSGYFNELDCSHISVYVGNPRGHYYSLQYTVSFTVIKSDFPQKTFILFFLFYLMIPPIYWASFLIKQSKRKSFFKKPKSLIIMMEIN